MEDLVKIGQEEIKRLKDIQEKLGKDPYTLDADIKVILQITQEIRKWCVLLNQFNDNKNKTKNIENINKYVSRAIDLIKSFEQNNKKQSYNVSINNSSKTSMNKDINGLVNNIKSNIINSK